MTPLKCKCKVISPMFLRGAYPLKSELRVASIKGSVRFWWRALNFPKYSGIQNLHDEEAKIFGFAEKGKSKVSFSLDDIELPVYDRGKMPVYQSFKEAQENIEGEQRRLGRMISTSRGAFNILDYLAYGVEKGMSYYRPGTTFSINYTFANNLNLAERESVLDAMAAMSIYGNLGAKNRNGFGKVWIESLHSRKERVDKVLFSGSTSPFTTGSDKAKFIITSKLFDYWDEALSAIGVKYYEGRIGIEEKGQHDTRKRYLLAQPLNEKSSSGGRGDFELLRHSKSLFMSVVPDGNKFRGQILYLPYNYLELSDDISKKNNIPVKAKNNIPHYQEEYHAAYKDLLDFLVKPTNGMTDSTPQTQNTETNA